MYTLLDINHEFFKIHIIYLAALGLSCDMRDLCCIVQDLLLRCLVL